MPLKSRCPYTPSPSFYAYVCTDQITTVVRDQCSQPISCPPSTLLCDDKIHCAASIEQCRAEYPSVQCPSYAPLLCWDKVCYVPLFMTFRSPAFLRLFNVQTFLSVQSLLCPVPIILVLEGMLCCRHLIRSIEECSYTPCSATFPYHCAHYCVDDINKCPSLISCPAEHSLTMMNECFLDDFFVFYDIYDYIYDEKFIASDLYTYSSDSLLGPETNGNHISGAIVTPNTSSDKFITDFTPKSIKAVSREPSLYIHDSYNSFIDLHSSTSRHSFNESFPDAYEYLPFRKSYNDSYYVRIFTKCPKGLYKCYDNSCVISISNCPSHVKYPL